MEGPGSVGRYNPLDNIQNSPSEGIKKAPAATHSEKLPSKQTVSNELNVKSGSVVNVSADIQSSIEGLKDGSGKALPSMAAVFKTFISGVERESSIKIAKTLDNTEQSPSIASIATSALRLAILEKLNREKKEL